MKFYTDATFIVSSKYSSKIGLELQLLSWGGLKGVFTWGTYHVRC